MPQSTRHETTDKRLETHILSPIGHQTWNTQQETQDIKPDILPQTWGTRHDIRHETPYKGQQTCDTRQKVTCLIQQTTDKGQQTKDKIHDKTDMRQKAANLQLQFMLHKDVLHMTALDKISTNDKMHTFRTKIYRYRQLKWHLVFFDPWHIIPTGQLFLCINKSKLFTKDKYDKEDVEIWRIYYIHNFKNWRDRQGIWTSV